MTRVLDRNRFYATERLSANMLETPEGYLICKNAAIARDGVLLYRRDEVPVLDAVSSDGAVHVHRSIDELASEKTLASFEGKPVTMGHPADFVGPNNWQDLAVGVVQNVRRGAPPNDDKIIADLVITNEDAIGAIKSHKVRELSCGYEADYVEDGGNVTQQSIIGNHVALVDEGRCGAECCIKDASSVNKREVNDMDAIAAVREELMALLKRLDDMSDDDTVSEESIDEEPVDEESAEESIDEEPVDEEDVVEESTEDEDVSAVEEQTDSCGRNLDRKTVSSIEIFAPGITRRNLDANTCVDRALCAAADDENVRHVIDRMTRGKRLFNMSLDAKSVILNAVADKKRKKAEKALTDDSFGVTAKSFEYDGLGRKAMDAKSINEINRKHYNNGGK